LAALKFFFALMFQGVGRMEAYRAIKREFNAGRTAFNKWQAAVEGWDESDWLPALTPVYCGHANRPPAEWPGHSRQFFLGQLAPGRPVKAAYDATAREAAARGWGRLPSLRTAKRYFDSLPASVKAEIMRDKKAQKQLAPTVRRDYSGFALHEQWSMDGRRLDVMTADAHGVYGEKGWKGRLWFYAVMDMRSRYVVGYAFGRDLNSDLVRAALLNAFDTTGRVIPQGIQVDNGMEAAAKEITGGAAWRRRGKVKEDEIIGMLSRIGIDISWATPAHGQTKPVERLFGTLARNTETRPEFRKAYMGSHPQARPEEYDPKHAVPVECLAQAYREELGRYHTAQHRGDAMSGKTPFQAYSELMTAPGFTARKLTPTQYRMSALAAIKVRLLQNGTFTIYGHSYYSVETADAPKGDLGYYALFNPNDLAAPVFLYCGNKLIAADVKQQTRAFGNDKQAAIEISKQRAALKKSRKAATAALQAVKPNIAPHAKALLDAQIEATRRENGETAPDALPTSSVLAIAPSKVDPLPKTPALTPEQVAMRAAFDEAILPERTKKRACR
jgi:transposase InsO family protein